MKRIVTWFIFLFTVCAQVALAQGDSTKTIGRISHMYKKNGCPTVIIVQSNAGLILIPKNKLPKVFDKDGMIISFNYRKLKMQNPKGCVKGLPAEITNVSKKK